MSKIVFMMLDGLRPDAINDVNTPNLSKFMKRGAYTMSALSMMPTMTLPCHTSIFHSVPSSRHGILDNEWRSMVRPVTGLVEQLFASNKRAGSFIIGNGYVISVAQNNATFLFSSIQVMN